MDGLTLSTCMAANMDFLSRELARYLSMRLSMPVHVLLDAPWQERERLLDAGEVDLCWICGLPYVRKTDQMPGRLRVLVAPVFADRRYQGQPVYFSDLVVHHDSAYQLLDDLKGAVWAYNETGSHSGYGVVRYELARRGKNMGFFGRVVESGAHQTSLEMILHKSVDASAIDSTVLEMELALHPEIAAQIHVIDSFGPSPIPPWVIGPKVTVEMQAALQNLLIHMHEDPQGQQVLRWARIARFLAAADQDYDPIRRMAQIAFS